eukprot:m.94794 g.94794  ORF g.94794 m.94794 type:complete len:69 (+) comp36828_c0_seq11:2663-2869(+)
MNKPQNAGSKWESAASQTTSQVTGPENEQRLFCVCVCVKSSSRLVFVGLFYGTDFFQHWTENGTQTTV